MTDTLTGRTIGKYQLLEKVGRGGMAEVYKAYQESLDRYVAIKLMHAFLASEQDFLQRFKREAKTMASLRHPNIVAVYDFDVYSDDTYYLVMEYIAGGTLKQHLEDLASRQEPLPLERSVQIALQVAEALDYAHKRGMIHRDVKPANIMLSDDNRAILTDFGIVKLIGGQSMAYTATGALIGTPSYMSPEQAMGKAGDERVDIYALGVLLFQMTTGQLPFSADTPLAVIMQHVNTPVPDPVAFNPNVPPDLQDVIFRAMAKEPDGRYQTARALADDLRAIRLTTGTETAVFITPPGAGTPLSTAVAQTAAANLTAVAEPSIRVAAPPPPPIAPPPIATPPTRKRPFWIWAVLGLVLLIGLAGGALALRGSRGEGQTTPVVAVVEAAATNTTEATIAPTQTDAPVAATTAAPATSTTAPEPTPTSKATTAPTVAPTQKPTATADATAAYLANCTQGVTLVNAFTYQNPRSQTVPVNGRFPMNWVLENSGSCPWPATLSWQYQSGAEFDLEAVPVSQAVQAGQTITLTANLLAPATAGNYESVWALVDTKGQTFGEPLNFTLQAYVPATATPSPTATPTATPTLEATPTSDQPVSLLWIVQSCEYIGTEWRCQLQITPYGGGGGPYTVWVFDADQPAEYRGTGQFYHFAKARRCATYNHEIRVQDDATGTAQSQQIYIDPNTYFPPACTLP